MVFIWESYIRNTISHKVSSNHNEEKNMRRSHREILLSVLPAILFLIVYKYVSYKVALIVGLMSGLLVFTLKYRSKGKFSAFDKIGIFGLVAQSSISIIAENPQIYFLFPLVQNIVFAAVFIISLFTSVDACSYIAKDFVDSESSLQLMRPTYRKLTVMWSLYYLLKVFVKIFGLMNWSFEELYTINWVLGTPVSLLLLFYSFSYPNKVYEKIHCENSRAV